MKKIYLFCCMGMSTSLLTENMRECARNHELPIEVKAFSVSEVDEIVKNDRPDVILLGPQIGYSYENIISRHPDIPVGVIDSDHYGMMDGEAVIKEAVMLLKSKK